MRTLILLFLLCTVSFLDAQFSTEKIISNQADGANRVHAVDIDKDGDIDVVSSSFFDNKIAWYDNDGSGIFSEKVISTLVMGATSVYASDLNNDTYPDVLSVSRIDDKIAWFENDQSGGFLPEQVLHVLTGGIVRDVFTADLNIDGYLDVLTVAEGSLDFQLAWYENLQNGTFSPPKSITTVNETNAASDVYVADLNNDTYPDVVATSFGDEKVAWYENDGSGNFSTQKIISIQADAAVGVYAVDLNGDSYLDVLSASNNDHKIAWYENDGSGGFSAQKIISTQALAATSVYAIDLDGDTDIDVLSSSSADNKIAWYKNDGSGNFSTEKIISTQAMGASTVFAADFDGDGKNDVLSASSVDDKIAWYKNECVTSINDFIFQSHFQVLPNPFSEYLKIENMSTNSDRSILSLFDVTGQEVRSVVLEAPTHQFSTLSLSKGLYFYKVLNDLGQVIGHGKIVKQ